MPFEEVGVRAVIEGLGAYLTGSKQMAAATADVGHAATMTGKQADVAAKSTGGLGAAFSGVAKIAAGFVVAQGFLKLPGLIGGTVGAASDLNETLSKSATVFGAANAKVLEFGASAAKGIGQSRQQAIEATATFGNFLTAMGLAVPKAADLSIAMVRLASDLASFNNASPEETLIALRSGLSGEIEPLRRFGVAINETAVQAKALSLGLAPITKNQTEIAAASLKLRDAQAAAAKAIRDHGKDSVEAQRAAVALTKAEEAFAAATKGSVGELSEAAKVQARYALIMEQTTTAQGDFARTADGLANRQRILAAQFRDLQTAIGTALLPIFVKLAGFAVNGLIPAIASLGREISRFASGAAKAFGSILGGGFRTNFVGELKAQLTGLFALFSGKAVAPEFLETTLGRIAKAVLGVGHAIGSVIGDVAELGRLFVLSFKGGDIGGDVSAFARAFVDLGQAARDAAAFVSGLVDTVGNLVHLFELGLRGGEIGGEFTTLQTVAFGLGRVIREDVLPVAQGFIDLIGRNPGILLAFAAAIGIVGAALLALNVLYAASIVATTAFGVAFAIATSPITIWVVAIAAAIAAGYLLIKNWDLIRAKADEVWKAIPGPIREFAEFFANDVVKRVEGAVAVIVGVFNLLKDGVELVLALIRGDWERAWKEVGEIGEDLAKIAVGLIQSQIGSLLTFMLDAVGDFARAGAALGTAIKDGIVGAVEGVGSAVKSALNAVLGALETAINAAISAYNAVANLPLNPLPAASPVTLPRLQQGTRFWRGGLAMLGEAGREAAFLPRGATVLSNPQTERLLQALAGLAPARLSMAGMQATTNTFAPVFQVSGATIDEQRAAVHREIDSYFNSLRSRSLRSGTVLTSGIR